MSEKLSVKLKQWRADRPDEWIMDEFIRYAEKMEAESITMVEHERIMEKQMEACADACYNITRRGEGKWFVTELGQAIRNAKVDK